MARSKSFVATPPGATIKEQLLDRNMSQKEFSIRMEMSEKHISKLINGEVQLTSDMAFRLEIVLGVPAQFWNRLESIYREKLIKIKAENDMESDLLLVGKLPYDEMAENGWVPETKKPQERVMYLRKFFEVVHLNLIRDSRLNKIACKKINTSENTDYALLAWAQKAKLEARKVDTAPIHITALNTRITAIREMTSLAPAEFCPKLKQLLSECGIALIFLPNIGGAFLHGATFYDGDKIILALTVDGNDSDKFWFSLFHELAHILYGHIKQNDGTSNEDEQAADDFARNSLIPLKEFTILIEKNDFSKDALRRFAAYTGIDPAIVVGRLQNEGLIERNCHNDLKVQYAFKS